MTRVAVEVDVDMWDFDTLDLIDELNERIKNGDRQAQDWAYGKIIAEEDVKVIVEKIWMARKLGVSADEYVNELVYAVLGRIL